MRALGRIHVTSVKDEQHILFLISSTMWSQQSKREPTMPPSFLYSFLSVCSLMNRHHPLFAALLP